MSAGDIVNGELVAVVVVLLVRLIVGNAYQRRTSKLWTFSFPTVALLIYFIRAILGRVTDLTIDDSAVAWTLGFVVISQLVATIYQWWPTRTAQHGQIH